MPDRPSPSVSAEQIAALSHEFRTPLNGVLGMARLLEGTRLTAEQRTYVGALRQSGEHLLGLVNDLLDLAKLGAGGAAPILAPMQPADLLREVAELMSPRAEEKGVEIAWASPPLPVVLGDEARLRQVLLNFAGNAVKFTAAGGVLLTARHDGARLRLEVRDSGPGVAAEARETIFEAFVQAEPGRDLRLGGAGLGLAVVRGLADMLGAKAGVDAAPEGGARFWFEVPASMAEPATTDRPPLQGRTVGVASPNAIVREAARRQIESAGGEAVVAEGLDALVLPPGAVRLVDRVLAGGRRLKAPAGGPGLVLLSPGERGLIPAARRAGFAGYLVKPLRQASLAARVLAAAEANAAPEAAPEDERARTSAFPGAKVLLAEDNPINALLARSLLEREGCAVVWAQGGLPALEAARAQAFDLILMDLRMPDLTGLEAARRLRAEGVAAPIVALTADAFDEDRRACLAAGMNDFAAKPLSPDVLHALLGRLAAARWTTPAGQAKVAS